MADTSTSDREAFYAEIASAHLRPLWEALDDLVPETPLASPVQAVQWRYEALRPWLMEAGELIGAEEAVRRVLVLENPGLPGSHAVTRAAYAGLQLVRPGEVAPCHRHAQSALRFVIEGEGAHTAVNGEPVAMSPFDLVLTPSGVWHDHGNESSEPMVWLDGLDIPLIQTLDCGYAHVLETPEYPRTRPVGDMLARHGAGLSPPREAGHEDTNAPFLCHYPYVQWKDALDRMEAAGEAHAHFGFKSEFLNSRTAGPVMSTLAAFAQRIPAGLTTAPYRSSDAVVLVVCEGDGEITIGEVSFTLQPRDIVIVPSWQVHTVTAGAALTLFSYSDQAVQRVLGVWREDMLS